MLHGHRVEVFRFTFDHSDGILWTLPQASSKTIAIIIGNEPSLAAFYGYGAFSAGDDALSTTVTAFLVDLNDFSFPAGMGRMPVVPFCLATVTGATLWNGFLLACGMKLREHWNLVMKYSHEVDLVVVLLLMIGLAWFLRSRLTRRNSRVPS